MVLGTIMKSRWKSIDLRGSLPPRDGLYYERGLAYGQSSPRILLRAYYACLFILAYSLTRYFTEI